MTCKHCILIILRDSLPQIKRKNYNEALKKTTNCKKKKMDFEGFKKESISICNMVK